MVNGADEAGGDSRQTLARSPMFARQVIAIAPCVLLNTLDGFDFFSISFASRGFAAEWGIGWAALSPVLGGVLFTAGYSLPTVAALMACGSLALAALLATPAREAAGH